MVQKICYKIKSLRSTEINIKWGKCIARNVNFVKVLIINYGSLQKKKKTDLNCEAFKNGFSCHFQYKIKSKSYFCVVYPKFIPNLSVWLSDQFQSPHPTIKKRHAGLQRQHEKIFWGGITFREKIKWNLVQPKFFWYFVLYECN